MVNWKGDGSKPQWPNGGIISAFVFRQYRKTRASVSAETLTGHLSVCICLQWLCLYYMRSYQRSDIVPKVLRALRYGLANIHVKQVI
jgi:hypothetical protein